MDAMPNSSRSSAATNHRTDQDHTVPAALSKKHYKKYEKSPAQTDYLEFAGRPHLMMAAEKWAEIAGAIEGRIAGVPEKTGAVAAGTASA